MRRREFVAFVVATAATWPFAVCAQTALPIVGFLDPTSLDKYAPFVQAFRKGLQELGFTEGHNVTIEFRWAEGQYARLPELAAELVKHNVAVIVATGQPVRRVGVLVNGPEADALMMALVLLSGQPIRRYWHDTGKSLFA